MKLTFLELLVHQWKLCEQEQIQVQGSTRVLHEQKDSMV